MKKRGRPAKTNNKGWNFKVAADSGPIPSTSASEGSTNEVAPSKTPTKSKMSESPKHSYPVAPDLVAIDGGPGVVILDNGASLQVVMGYRIMPRGDGFFFLTKAASTSAQVVPDKAKAGIISVPPASKPIKVLPAKK